MPSSTCHNTGSRLLPPVLLTTAMFSAMGGPVLAPILPFIKAAYAEIPHIEFWCKNLIAITGLFSALGALLFGRLSDRCGRRRSLLIALGAWGLFGASGLLPQPFWTLMAARAGLGLAVGGLLTANSSMIAACFSRDRQRGMMGMQSAFSSSGVVLGLVISGWLAGTHWRWPFALFLIAFAVLPIAQRLPEPPRQEPGRRTPLAAPRGLLPLYIFGFMVMLAFNIVPTQLPFSIKAQGGMTARHMGLLLALMPVASAVTGRLYARCSKRCGLWSMFPISGALMWTGLHVMTIRHATGDIAAGLILLGMGFGLAMPHVNVVVSYLTPEAARGRAMGTLTGCKFLGQFFSPILLQPLLAQAGYFRMLQAAGWLMLVTALGVGVLGYLGRHNHPSEDTA